jgi:hypothetical protein
MFLKRVSKRPAFRNPFECYRCKIQKGKYIDMFKKFNHLTLLMDYNVAKQYVFLQIIFYILIKLAQTTAT